MQLLAMNLSHLRLATAFWRRLRGILMRKIITIIDKASRLLGQLRNKVWPGYAMAAVGTGIAVWLRVGLGEVYGEGIPHFLTFYPAIIASSLLGGIGAGVVATFLAAGTVACFFMGPNGSLVLQKPGDLTALAIFVFVNLLMSVICGGFRAARLRSEQQTQQLSDDLKHLNRMYEIQRQTEQRLRLVSAAVESAADAIVITDSQGAIEWANEAFRRLTGYSVSEAIGKNTRILKSGKMPPELYQELWQTILEGRVWHGQMINRRKDGTLYPEEMTIAPVRNKAGQIVNFVAVKLDMTARQESEGRLQRQLEQLTLLEDLTLAIGQRQDLSSIFQVAIQRLEDQLPLDFACVCIRENDPDQLRVASVGLHNQNVATLAGLGADSTIPVEENGFSRCMAGRLVYEQDTELLEYPMAQRLALGGLRSILFVPLQVESQVFGVLMVGRKEPGAFTGQECRFIKEVSAHVALASHQTRLHSALKKAYDELRQSQQALMQQERLRALGQMASGIAHDINNALVPASIYADSLLETEANLSEKNRKGVQTIQSAIRDVASTVSRMREFYRRREPEITLLPVQINALVEEVLDLTRSRWSAIPHQHGTVIEVSCDLAGSLPSLMAVESEIREALVNLVFNAVDAMPDGGKLSVRTRLERDEAGLTCLAIEVQDTGIGMDEETRRHCLEPFFTTKGEHGTGLGLAMVYGIVRRHAGSIDIETQPGQGTTMRLNLPVTVAPATPPMQPATLKRPPRLRLLLVDDDPLVLDALRAVLEADGHVVTQADGGQNGIDTFRAARERGNAFAVVITDLGMPSVDGRAVARAVKEASPETPVLLLTGWGAQMQADGEVPANVDEVMSKPVTLDQLRQALARWCGSAAKLESSPA
jgi:PAS domain S-box-containing protein